MRLPLTQASLDAADAALPPDTGAPDAADASVPCVIPADAWAATVESPPLPPETAPVADSVLTVALPANDLLYDPYTQLLYVSVPSSVGANANSIARIDPTTGTVVGTVYVGSEPGPLAESADGQFIYVGLSGAKAVRRYVVATQSPDLQFPFAEPEAEYDVAVSLAVLPTSPHSVLVGTGTSDPGWVGVYDDGVIRGAPLQESDAVVSTGSDALALAPPSAYASGVTDVLCIDWMGVHVASSITAAISNYEESAPYYKYASGILYSENGAALNVASGLLAGTYGSGGALAVEPRVDRVFFLTGSQIVSYTLDHFTPAGSISITVPWDEVSRLVRWGRYGFAFLSGSSGSGTQIAVVRTSLVPAGP